MTQDLTPTLQPPADQLMRRMLHAISRLQSAYAKDAAELQRLASRRQAEISAAQKVAREAAERDMLGPHDFSSSTSLGDQLREQLTVLPHVEVRHVDSGPAPGTLQAAIDEWQRLAASTEQRVKEVSSALLDWDRRLLKRVKTAPQVPDEIWQDLDRLDVLHRSRPALQQTFIAERVQEAATAAGAAADAAVLAERRRQETARVSLVSEVTTAVTSVEALVGTAGAAWSDARWANPEPSHNLQRLLRLGDLLPDLPSALGIPAAPALLAFPMAAGLALGADIPNREAATGLLRSLVLRLLAAVPPGNLHVKAVDPVALGQSVAEFRHLGEYDSQLMDEKTWTAERDIERLMDDLSDHLELVISTYLRGQFDSIDDYNHHAGEVAQPYRALIVFDYPAGFSERAARQLLSLIENGPRCGVYTLLHYNRAAEGHREVSVDRLVHSMAKVLWDRDSARLELPEAVGALNIQLAPDAAPPVSFDKDGQPETNFARLLPRIGERVKRLQSSPPTVTLDSLLPILSRARAGVLPAFDTEGHVVSTDPATWWAASTTASAVAPLGRTGAQGVASMFFSSTDVAGGAIMVGLPRSGKTTSLHALILNMCMLYSPEELELYLIDAKHGVEFKAYQHLPHARMVSVHSEREFSLAVLKSLQAKIRERAELIKSHGGGLSNITEYRRATGDKLPRIVVVIDEFHELFEETDTIGFEAFAAFSDIVRMGPFSGVHIVVASQTLSSMPAMDRQTLVLLPQRVAFMCNDYDAEIVMGVQNKAVRLLSKTGEGLFNPARGDEAKNQPFQGLYVPPDQRAALLQAMQAKARNAGWTRHPRVFDGDAVVDRPALLEHTGPATRLAVPLGEPFTLADRDTLVLPRTRGANLLLLGDRDATDDRDLTLRGVLHSLLVAAQHCGAATSTVDFLGDEDLPGETLTVMEAAATTGGRYLRAGALGPLLREVAETVTTRSASGSYREQTQVLVLFGLQRALTLSPYDGYASDDGGDPPIPELLATIIVNGPEVGVHVVVDADSSRSVEARLGSGLTAEFMFRLAGSATEANDLGLVSGSYGAVPPPRFGQLLIADHLKGTARRARGYALLNSTPSLTDRERSSGR